MGMQFQPWRNIYRKVPYGVQQPQQRLFQQPIKILNQGTLLLLLVVKALFQAPMSQKVFAGLLLLLIQPERMTGRSTVTNVELH